MPRKFVVGRLGKLTMKVSLASGLSEYQQFLWSIHCIFMITLQVQGEQGRHISGVSHGRSYLKNTEVELF